MKDNNDINSEHQSEERDQPTNDFSNELNQQNNQLDADKFAQKQAEYNQMLGNNAPMEDDPYMWRVSFGRRLGAYLIDIVVYTVILLFFGATFGFMDMINEMVGSDPNTLMMDPEVLERFTENLILSISPFVILLTFIFYSIEIFLAQSVGKIILGIKIGNAVPGRASISQLGLRLMTKCSSYVLLLFFVLTSLSFFSTLSSIASVAIFIGCFFALSGKKQALHDMIAKTAIYYKDELAQFENNPDAEVQNSI